MNDDSEDDMLSTPEKRINYVQQWLNDNPVSSPEASTEQERSLTPLSKTRKKENEFLSPQSPPPNSRDLARNFHLSSPVFGQKRASSSPVLGDRNRLKRIKAGRKLNSKLNLAPLLEASITKKYIIEESPDELNISFEHDVSSISKETEIQDCNSIPETPTRQPKKTLNKHSLAQDQSKKFSSNVSETSEQVISQLIESVSSDDKSPQKIEIHVPESQSDTDKTLSDLIEELPTQLDIASSSHESKHLTTPQISNPQSEFSQLENSHEPDTTTSLNYRNRDFKETDSPADIIESVGTSESRADVTKTCYICPHNVDKSKKKKNPKKGSLLEALTLALAKERSNVNLLRHELRKKTSDFSEKPFLLLQVVENQLTMNENQFVKCLLIEDSKNLLKDLLTNRTSNFLTVINVPDVSGTINLDHKPLLKIYEPWTVLDSRQVLISITRFVAMPSAERNLAEVEKIDEGREKLYLINEFSCPCIDEKAISVDCRDKFCDESINVVKIVFNDST
ncbi:hypothetical protein QAD02_000084 [Eretmocerus hayati]|uniref:Uncharacterized protein n=1 Tax=Eretmocerus hayati TaxID=131215 RepID=A0ACC2NCG0_9HYME|nr:hypothetical protein QAD02_000084 [Eretmocerus hayati]